MGTGLIVGCVFAGMALQALLVGLVYYLRKRPMQKPSLSWPATEKLSAFKSQLDYPNFMTSLSPKKFAKTKKEHKESVSSQSQDITPHSGSFAANPLFAREVANSGEWSSRRDL